MSNEFITVIDTIAKEKGIDREKLMDAIKQSIEAACKKHFGAGNSSTQNLKITINEGKDAKEPVSVFATKVVVDEYEVYNDLAEIDIRDAKEINSHYQIGDLIDIEITPKNFGRIAAQNAKQIVIQKIKEAERQMVYETYIVKLNDIVKGQVVRQEKNGYIVMLDHTEAYLPAHEAMPNDHFDKELETGNPKFKTFYITNVRDFNSADDGSKKEDRRKNKNTGAQVTVSRTHPEMVKRLFEQEVVEIKDGTVLVKSIAREAGSRTKMAVFSNNPNVDAVGSCVGEKGRRINAIVDELNGEKIDIIHWSEDPKEFIKEALSPAQVLDVELNEENDEKNAVVTVPSNLLTLAIGKGGQNVRLAARLTGWKLDIKSRDIEEEPVQEATNEVVDLSDLDEEAMENLYADVNAMLGDDENQI